MHNGWRGPCKRWSSKRARVVALEKVRNNKRRVGRVGWLSSHSTHGLVFPKWWYGIL